MNRLLALFILLPVLVNAQDKLMLKGDELFSLQQYNEALTIYLKVESKLIDSTAKYPVLLQIASCYANLHNPKQAIKYFSSAFSLDNNFTPEQSIDYANAFIETGQYDQAKSVLINLSSGSIIEQILLDKCEYALSHTEIDRFIQTQAMKLQEGYSNYGMTLYNKRLLYVQFMKSRGSSQSKSRFVYEGELDVTLKNLMDEDLPFNINSPSFDHTQKTLYFSASASELKKYNDSKREEEEIGLGGINNLFIYTASISKDDFTPKKLPFNHIDYSCTHPFITADGLTLYFSSNMLGGYGGFDLYMAAKTPTGWGPPVNMGKKINTVMNEGYPYINDGNLYFSSDGHPGFGALDIYRFNFETQEIEYLKKPINSSYDDFSYIQNNPNDGYFSSNRNSNDGSDLIFHFKNVDPALQNFEIIEPPQNIEITKLKVDVVNYLTENTQPEITIKITNAQGFQSIGKSDNSGQAVFNMPVGQYNLVVTGNEFLPDTSIILVKNDQLPQTIKVKPDLTKTEKLVFRNLTFNYDKAMVSEESMPLADNLADMLIQNPSISIEIDGYTDSRGESYYNSLISELMAKSLMNYLIKKGVAKNRLTAVGFGESKILNKCTEGIDCTEEEHSFNKRIEIKITNNDTAF